MEGDRPVHSTNESIFVIPVDVTFRKENGSTDIQQDHGDQRDGDLQEHAWKWHSTA